MATADGGNMQSFQKHIEDMRSLTLCKICLKPFFEPYIISCGHTYCYGCLRSWFGDNTDRTKTKSCPDCRIVVRVPPAPNYILRDLTHMFIGRAELLPEDESVQEHDKDKAEAAAQLTRDRDGLGLFQGVFNRILPTHLRGPIHDLEDGVDRCPVCSWEIEDGMCAGCGLDMGDSDYDSEDSSDSITVDIPRAPQGMFYGVGSDSEDESSEDESNLSGPNEYDHHDDFLDNENEDDVDDMDSTEAHEELFLGGRHPHRNAAAFRRHRRVAWSDEDVDEEEDDDVGVRHEARSNHPAEPFEEDSATNYDESDNEMEPETTKQRSEAAESDDEQPMAGSRVASNNSAFAVAGNRRRPVVIDDDEEEEDEEDDQPGHASFSSQAGTESSANEEDDSDEDDLPSSQRSDSGSDSQESSGSESESETDAHHEIQDASDSEDTDETVQPPQPRRVRQQKLQNQRARRPQQHLSRALPSMSNYSHNGPDERLGPRGQTSKATRVY